MFVSADESEFTPAEDSAEAALSPRRSDLFRDAYFTSGGEKDRADLIMTGEMKSTKSAGGMRTYGLSFDGPLLWFFGAPTGNPENTVSICPDLERRDGTVRETGVDRRRGRCYL